MSARLSFRRLRFRRALKSLALAAAILSPAAAPAQVTFTTLVEFTGTSGARLGRSPLANLIQGSDGLLYGTTYSGGPVISGIQQDYGTIFRCTTAGASFTTLKSFTAGSPAGEGFYPNAGVALHSDGSLFGCTSGLPLSDANAAVTNSGYGNIFRLTSVGNYSVLRFGGSQAANRGRMPTGPLTLAGGVYYGTTEYGGTYNKGTLFSLNPTTLGITYHVDFTGALTTNAGARPRAQLVDGGDGYLYGSTVFGGGNDSGTLFRFNISSKELTTLVEFSNVTGAFPGKYPNDAMIKASDGHFYGTTINGGSNQLGVVFKLTLSPTMSYSVLGQFSGGTGSYQGAFPYGRLAEHANGLLYGTTSASGHVAGSYGNGTIFSISKAGLLTPKVVEFTGTSGSFKGAVPGSGLIKGTDGDLYGTTTAGGAGDHGTVYKLSIPNFTAPVVTTTAATSIAGTSATLNGTVNPGGGDTTYAFEYGLTTTYTSSTSAASAGAGTTAQNVSFNLTGLQANTTYNYRIKASNSAGIVTGSNMTFTTTSGTPVLPVVTTGSASALGDTTATLNGTVNPNGSATTYQFEYGTTTAFGSTTVSTSAGSGTSAQSVSAALSGLLSGTSYYFRLTATSGAGTVSGTQGTFSTTGSPPEPGVVTGNATNITGTSARLTGTVNPRGAQAHWLFEWGLSEGFGNSAPSVAGTTAAGSSDVTVTADLTNLLPGTTVYYRLTAWRTSQAGAVYGINSFFRTLTLPSAIATAATGLSTTGATLNGTVNPQGLATTWQFEYGEGGYDFSVPATPGDAGSGSSAVPVSFTISGLTPGATIQYRIKAVSAAGTAYSGAEFFTTHQPPTPVTGAVSGITPTAATLAGTVNPNGFSATYFFEYGTSQAYGQSTAATSAGSGSSPVNAGASLSGLLPNTTYYYRLAATSTHGTAYGLPSSFTTQNNIRGWRQQYFSTMNNAGNAHDDADPDGDGVKNLLEYAFGMNPNVRDSQLVPRPAWNGANLIISFTKPAAVNDISYSGEVSTNLANWVTLANSGGGNALTFSAPVSSVGRNWMRIRVALIP